VAAGRDEGEDVVVMAFMPDDVTRVASALSSALILSSRTFTVGLL